MHHNTLLEDGRVVTEPLFRRLVDEEMGVLQTTLGDSRFSGGEFARAIELFTTMSTSDSFEPFLTIPAYQHIVQTVD